MLLALPAVACLLAFAGCAEPDGADPADLPKQVTALQRRFLSARAELAKIHTAARSLHLAAELADAAEESDAAAYKAERLTTHVHDVRPLIGQRPTAEAVQDLIDRLVELAVPDRSADGVVLAEWQGALAVRHTHRAHKAVAAALAHLHRAAVRDALAAKPKAVPRPAAARDAARPGPWRGPTTFGPDAEPLDAMAERIPNGSAFAMDLHRQFTSGMNGNLAYSPASIRMTMAMAYAASAGNTAGEMADVLHFDQDPHATAVEYEELLRAMPLSEDDAAFRLDLANALWGAQGFPPEYAELLEASFNAHTQELDFSDLEEACRVVNDWTAEQTGGLIPELVTPTTLSRQTIALLTNAVYFKARWKQRFDATLTEDRPFWVDGDRREPVPTMRHDEVELPYGRGEGFAVLELPYAGGDCSMFVLLPDAADGLAELEQLVWAEGLDETLGGMNPTELEVYLPRFTMECGFTLNDTLQSMGMVDAFIPGRASFPGMGGKVWIGKVLHKAVIIVNEEGTEAAAATGASVGFGPLPKRTVFDANRPFLFVIRHNETGAMLFAGRVTDPQDPVVDAITWDAPPSERPEPPPNAPPAKPPRAERDADKLAEELDQAESRLAETLALLEQARDAAERSRADRTDVLTRKQVQERLDRRICLDVSAVGIADVILFLRKVTGLTIRVNWEALDEHQLITKRTPVSAHLSDVTIRRAMEVVLADVGGDRPLRYIIEDGEVFVSTRDDLAQRLVTHSHDVRDLLAEGPVSRAKAVQALTDTIRRTVKPGTWAANPKVALHEFRGSLIVTHTHDAHQRIVALLFSLRAALAAREAGKAAPDRESDAAAHRPAGHGAAPSGGRPGPAAAPGDGPQLRRITELRERVAAVEHGIADARDRLAKTVELLDEDGGPPEPPPLADRERANTKAREALDRRIELHADALGLREAIDRLRDASGANFWVNWTALDEHQLITRETPITAELTDVTVRTALDIILADAGGDRPLEYVIENGVVTVSTQDDLAWHLVTRCYELQDLLGPGDRSAQIEDLVHLISDAVESGTWQANPELGIREFAGLLVVTHTPQAQRQVENLLDTLRRMLAEAPPASDPHDDEVLRDATIREKLDRTISVELDEVLLRDVIEFLRNVSEANIWVNWSALEEHQLITAETPITAELTDVTVRTALDTILADAGGNRPLVHAIEEGVIVISTQDDLAMKLTTRVYDVRDLLDSGARAPQMGELIKLITNSLVRGMWHKRLDRVIRVFDGLLVVKQTPRMQASIAKLLRTIRHTRSQPPPDADWRPYESEWDRTARKKLRKRIDLDIGAIGLQDVISFLRNNSEVAIWVNWSALEEQQEIGKSTPVAVHLENVTVREALEAVLYAADPDQPLAYVVDEGVVSISTADDLAQILQRSSYDVRDLLGREGAGGPDSLVELIRTCVAPESWAENYDVGIEEFGGVLFVTQTRANQRSIGALLLDLRTALRDSAGPSTHVPVHP